MKVHDAELLVRYCADIPARLAGIRRECAMLDDEVDTLRGMNMDGMPRGGAPGDSTGMMACKMDELGIGDRLRELERQKVELQADAKLIQGQIDSLKLELRLWLAFVRQGRMDWHCFARQYLLIFMLFSPLYSFWR